MNEQYRLDNASEFYIESQLCIDKKLIHRRYESNKRFFAGRTALELGPADGVMTGLLANDFDRLVVVDGSKDLLDRIPSRSNIVKVYSLFEDYRPSEKFDTVVLEHVLEHVENPVNLLKTVKAWVSPGGVVIAGVPNANSIHRLAAVKMGMLSHCAELNERDIFQGHRRVYTLDGLIADFDKAGIVVSKTGGLFLKPLSHKQIEETWTEAMIQAFFDLGEKIPEYAADIYVVARF